MRLRSLPYTLLSAAALSVTTAMPSAALAQQDAASRTITVTGEGVATGSPDIAMLDFGVVVEADTAGEAISQNAARMSAVSDALEALGIEARDIQTSNFSLGPRYEEYTSSRGQRTRTVRYSASNQITVRVRDLSKVGEAIDKTVAAGANTLNSLTFSFQNPDEMLTEARRLAIRDAQAKASLMAEEAGASLGAVMRIDEINRGGRPESIRMRAAAMDVSAAPTPIEAGESALRVSVNIIWELE